MLEDLQTLKLKALEIRKLTIEEIGNFGSGHIGGSMSIVEMLTYLYYHEMHVDHALRNAERTVTAILQGEGVACTLAEFEGAYHAFDMPKFYDTFQICRHITFSHFLNALFCHFQVMT